jgi:hypothetical protein
MARNYFSIDFLMFQITVFIFSNDKLNESIKIIHMAPVSFLRIKICPLVQKKSLEITALDGIGNVSVSHV